MRDPLMMIRPRRKIEGISAVLLPFLDSGEIDWPGFRELLRRTVDAGLTPAVNMDTGYGNLLDVPTRVQVLETTRDVLGGERFVAGAFADDAPGAGFDLDAYALAIEPIQKCGAVPVIFQSYGLTGGPDEAILEAYRAIAARCDRFIGFELGSMFAPFGRIYSLELYRGLMDIPACVGAKHSSLRRDQEWDRIALRDAARPDFRVYTGNDLAIDMVMFGSDYLLGLSAFAPDVFARRDACWASGDPAFFELNDALQYLGAFAFRPPVPSYKHTAAQFLKMRNWITSEAPHPKAMRRPESDLPILREILARLGV